MPRAPALLSTLIVGSALLGVAGPVQALGFGRVITASYLGQPLNFASAVRLEGDESLPRECVSAEVMQGDSRLPKEAIVVTVEPGSDPQERLVHVTTQVRIDEPVVTVTVSAGCIPRLTRSFVSLMDPPGVNLAQAGPLPTLPPQRVDTQVAPVVAVAQAAEAAAAPAPRPAAQPAAARAAAAASPAAPAASRARPARSATAAAPTAPRERRSAAARAPAPRPESGARLRLDPPATLVATAASAPPLETQPAIAEAASAAASAASAAAAAQQRLATLEESIEHLREESQAHQKALATLQASLQEAQAARYANPLVYALAWISALLALGVVFLLWRQSQARNASQWWLAPSGGAAAANAAAARPVLPQRAETGPSSRVETAPAVMDDRAVERTLDDLPLRRSGSVPARPDMLATTGVPVVVADPPVLRRELSVEELIDLEQQADFFVVLGQDDAAIDLLMGHVRSSGGVSPLPYLKLLEIYRRRGEHDAYERIRERFNRRFSAYAPDWDADLQQGRAIDEYPKMVAQLQRLWDEPSRVTQMLDAALMRQDGSGETFDLPAYRELLFLYSIARDLAEHPATAGAIDLLLPLDGEVPEEPIERLTASRLMGFASTVQREPVVDLDVTAPLPFPSRSAAPAPGATPPASDFLGLVDPRLKDTGSDRQR